MTMTMRNLILGGASALLAMGSPALGQTATATDTPAITAQPDPAAPLGRGTLDPGLRDLDFADLDDMDVYSVGGERIGEVDRAIRRGGELYLVMQIEEWYDPFDERVAVPIDYFQMGVDGLILPITEEQADALEEYVDEIEDEVVGAGTVGDAFVTLQ